MHDNTCPSCCQSAETIDHFLPCPHIDWQQVWKELHDQLHQHQLQHSISNVFHNLLAYGLYTGQSKPHCIMLHHLPSDIQALFDQQATLGWKQLYFSQFSPEWIAVMQFHHPQINGVTYY